MSVNEYHTYPEVDEKLYELFLSWCHVNEVTPDIKGFYIWMDDQDLDNYEVGDGYER